MKMKETEDIKELRTLCGKAKALLGRGEFTECEKVVCEAMSRYPHMPEPNNLLGILLEKQGNHVLAMKHFRAAWALDPAYRPARQNLEYYGSFFPRETIAFDESDCPPDSPAGCFEIKYDSLGVGHAVRRK